MSRFLTFLKIEFLVKYVFLTFIYIYRLFLKPLFMSRPVCRFQPSCSEYSLQSFKQFNSLKALRLTALRLSKCHPFGSYGYDPIPNNTCGDRKV